MAQQFTVTTGLTSLSAATARTLIEIRPNANTSGELIALTVSSSYLTTATPIGLQVELGTAGSGGTGSAATPKRVGTAVGTAASAASINDTIEPGTFVAAHAWDLVLPGDRLDYLWPLGREFMLSVSTVNCIRLTATAACSCRVTAWFEE